jgi:predicted aldo/keto reductase-like oxidoreductase
MTDLKRRDFLRTSALTVAAAGMGTCALADQQDSPAGIPTRPLGRSGERVSIVGLGGYHIGTVDEKQAIRIMHEAIDEGMTFFDNAWDYHNGGSEQIMGKALATGGRRQKVFLMTKNCARDYQGSRQHLEDSLRRLQTDCIDLWQFHEINWPEASDWIVDRGALKYALEARDAGKVRYIGFTGHKDIDHHLRMLGKTAGGDFEWDTVQMPINVLDPHYRSFQKEVVPECNRRKISVVGMKALAAGTLPKTLDIPAADCRRYALSQPISTLVCGIRSRENLRQDLEVARNFRPMSGTELAGLLAKTKAFGIDGKYERFKTTTQFNGPYHRRQHGEA